MPRLPHPGRRAVGVRLASLAFTAVLLTASVCADAQQAGSNFTELPAPACTSPIDGFVAEASARFGIPEPWIRAVIRAESGGRVRAVSAAGAMGLMQLMPGTWAELRARYRLGSDPFDPRDNILAGTAYLREMYDRFGSPGFLAAYNAGPESYARHLATGRPLPRETRAYIASLAPLVGGSSTPPLQSGGAILTVDWRGAPLFVAQVDQRTGDASADEFRGTAGPSIRSSSARAPQSDEPLSGLFVRSRGEEPE